MAKNGFIQKARIFVIVFRERILGSKLENFVAESFKRMGYITFIRKHHCDIVALNIKGKICYLVECKSYPLSNKQQRNAVRELNRNYQYAIELLQKRRLIMNGIKIIKVLVAPKFSYQGKNILQYTPRDLIKHIEGVDRF